MNRVQPWAEHCLETLRGSRVVTLQVRELADVLRHVSDDEYWRAFEQELTGQLVCVYDLKPSGVHLDSTTTNRYGAVSEDGLLHSGHSKDHRPDLGQLKVMLATLDMPLATEVLSGEWAEDTLYLPTIARVRAYLNIPGLLYVGDSKWACWPLEQASRRRGTVTCVPCRRCRCLPTN